MRGKQWCDYGDHWFVEAFGHGEGELVDMRTETILVCVRHLSDAEACAKEDAWG